MFERFIPFSKKRVPVLLQMNATECGAAALAMIAHYYGYDVSVRDVSKRCHIGRDGVTARVITGAARDFGFRVKSYRADIGHLNRLRLPAIIHWNFNHFVVLEHISGDIFEIVDPARGRRRVSADEFRESFTGIIITLEPGADFQQQTADDTPFWWRYLQHLLRLPEAKAALAQLLLALVLLQLIGLSIPALTQALVDAVLPSGANSLMTLTGLGLLVIIGTQLVISAVRLLLLMRLQIALDSQVMLGFFEHLLRLPFGFFQRYATGDLVMRLSSNALIRETLSNQVLTVIFDALFGLSYLLILLFLSVPYALATLGLGLVQGLIILGTIRQLRRLTDKHVNAQAQSQSYIVEVLRGISTLKASGGEALAFDQWTDLFFKELNLGVRRNLLSSFVDTSITVIRLFSPLILLWAGGWYVLNGSITLGQLLAWNALSSAFLLPISSFVNTGQKLQLILTHLQRIEDVVDTPIEATPKKPLSLDNFSGQIRLEEVSFRYYDSGPYVLKDISLTIEAGQKVALVGATGSGKSTLASMLVGLNLPTNGQIYYDDKPLDRLYLTALRENFGVVLQENFLFNSSVRANIAFYRPGASLEAVVQAARIAAIHTEIVAMPMGYETMVGESGNNLSGGQRQRVALARAVLHQPNVLLLDEATSHLDTVTESRVDRALDELNYTRIIIAHRLSTIINADWIVCLQNGQIREQGTHDTLMANRDYYYSLHHEKVSRPNEDSRYEGQV
jgi:ABC-type bacteriocin/lantibiotic exporter with double-glycine peptidase domain